LRLIRTDVRRQHGPRNRSAGDTDAADAAVVAALDRVLDPIERLRQEEFQSETAQAEATAASTEFPRARKLGRHWRLAVPLARLGYGNHLAARLRHSNRAPYRQLREAAYFCFGMIGVLAIVWLVLGHTS
jgi:hypothetical protein